MVIMMIVMEVAIQPEQRQMCVVVMYEHEHDGIAIWAFVRDRLGSYMEETASELCLYSSVLEC
jgi:hypothetical protein